jgi:hypothetical protein
MQALPSILLFPLIRAVLVLWILWRAAVREANQWMERCAAVAGQLHERSVELGAARTREFEAAARAHRAAVQVLRNKDARPHKPEYDLPVIVGKPVE